MYKRIQQRKNKTRLKIGILLCSIFISVLFVLIIMSWRLTKDHQLVSPIALSQPINVLGSHNDIILQVVKDGLQKQNIQYDSAAFGNDDAIHIQLKDNQGEVLFSPTKDIVMQITSLQLTMNHFTIEGKPFKRLDFRFDKPVVTF